jgi:hypothetical protein
MTLNIDHRGGVPGIPASRMQLVLMRVGQALLIVLAPLAVLSGVRAWVQVWSLDVQVNESPARVGSVLSASVLTSGRTYVDVTLELLQDGQTHLVGGGRVDTHWDPAMDPRPRRGSGRCCRHGSAPPPWAGRRPTDRGNASPGEARSRDVASHGDRTASVHAAAAADGP